MGRKTKTQIVTATKDRFVLNNELVTFEQLKAALLKKDIEMVKCVNADMTFFKLIKDFCDKNNIRFLEIR